MNRAPFRINLMIGLAFGILFQEARFVAFAAGVRTVALTGQPAPGTASGVAYDSFGSHYDSLAGRFFRGPVLNDAGHVAFRADVAGSGVNSANNQGIWSEGLGSLSLVARTGAHAAGAPDGVNFRIDPELELFAPVMNNAGQAAFYAGLTDGSVGIWMGDAGGLSLVARSGVQAPGAPAGANLSFSTSLNSFHLDWPKVNDAGQTAFMGALTGTGVTSANNWGVWSNGSGSLELTARAGDQAPGTPGGTIFGVSIFTPFPAFVGSLNDAGHIALWANLAGTGVIGNQSYGIWSGAANSLALVTRSGNQAPGVSAGVNIDIPLGVTALNNAGQVAFAASLAGSGVNSTNNEGLLAGATGGLALIARKGNHAAGTPAGVNYLSFSPSYPVLNDVGQVAFRGNLSGSGVDSTNNLGIWSDGSSELELVARTGSHALGTAAGVNFFDLHFPSLNSVGQTAFRANLIGAGVDFTNDRGVWATDTSGNLQLIVRSGDQLEVSPGDLRTIADLDFVSATGNGDSRSSGFNSFGQLAFWATFTDGSQGVFLSNKVATAPGDFNFDGSVDAADYAVWRKGLGTLYTQAHFEIWRANFGTSLASGGGQAMPSAQLPPASVPEPANAIVAATVVGALLVHRRRQPQKL